jgi:hypothetical protein
MKKMFFVFMLFGLLFSLSSAWGKTILVPSEQPTIQAGVDAAVDGDIVLVAAGMYSGEGNRDISFQGKEMVVISESGSHHTFINCERLGRGFAFTHQETFQSELSGFQILNGCADWGGGIYCHTSSPTITNCTISHNYADEGGGVYIYGPAAPTMVNCAISENESEHSGGGMFLNWESNPTISNCIISENVANGSGSLGGGVYCWADSPVFTNCIIAGNTADYWGGGLSANWDATPQIINCVIANNVSNYGGAGLSGREANPCITNSIIWDEIYFGVNCFPEIRYSDVRGGFMGVGNIDEDPLFASYRGSNYLLSPKSPCIDTGDPAIQDYIFEWHPKCPKWYKDGARSDMGAYGGPGNVGWLK